MGRHVSPLVVLGWIFLFAVAAVGLIFGTLAFSNTQKDDYKDSDSAVLTCHWDITSNETFTVKLRSNGKTIDFTMQNWNGTLSASSGTYLTSSCLVPSKYLPNNFNATTAQPNIVPLFHVVTTAGTIQKGGYLSINPSRQFYVFRDETNTTSTWNVGAGARGQIGAVSGTWDKYFTINY